MSEPEAIACAGRRRDLAAAVVTLFVIVIAVTSGVQSTHTQQRLEANIRCQGQVNSELRDRIKATEPASTAQLQAQLELLTTPPGDPERGRAALARYVQGLRDSLAARQANPIPTRNC